MLFPISAEDKTGKMVIDDAKVDQIHNRENCLDFFPFHSIRARSCLTPDTLICLCIGLEFSQLFVFWRESYNLPMTDLLAPSLVIASMLEASSSFPLEKWLYTLCAASAEESFLHVALDYPSHILGNQNGHALTFKFENLPAVDPDGSDHAL